jgi:predicted RNase H-like HicB family nuclease
MPTYRFQVVIEQDEEGLYVAECPALEGCYTQGGTFEEAVANIQEVIRMCVRELEAEGQPIEPRYPEVVGLKTIEVAL